MNYGYSCVACGSYIKDMLKKSNDFYIVACKCEHTSDVVCVPCIERGIPNDKVRSCSRCGGSLSKAQLYRSR